MKKILILSMLSFSICVHAQTDSTEIQDDSLEVQVVTLPDSTAIGTPDGKLVTKEIGPLGGTIISDDGRVELIFPDSALTAATTISIQPITNLVPNGSGKAYQFEPSGIHFKKPVEIIFHYTQEEEDICPALLKFMAIQSGNGKWEYMDYDDWDSSAKTLTASISHFSGFLNGNEVVLVPEETTLKVGHKQLFYLKKVLPPAKESSTSNETGEDELPALPVPDVHLGDKEKAMWYVNNIPGGNGSVGKINRVKNETIQAEFIAPNTLPASEVKVKLNMVIIVINKKVGRAGKKMGKMITKESEIESLATFTCLVHLYDQFKITVSMNFGKGSDMEFNDVSTFVVKVSDQVELSGIENNMLQVVLRMKKCKPVYTNEGRCAGMINVRGLQMATIDPNKSPGQGFMKVNMTFLPAPSCLPIFDFSSCRDPTPTPPFHGSIAFPVRISFETKNEKQILSLGAGNGAVVKKADPDDITAIIEPVRE
jgi:hypothetical protein